MVVVDYGRNSEYSTYHKPDVVGDLTIPAEQLSSWDQLVAILSAGSVLMAGYRWPPQVSPVIMLGHPWLVASQQVFARNERYYSNLPEGAGLQKRDVDVSCH